MMKRTLHRYAALVAKVVLIAQPLVLLSACQQGDDSEPQPRNTPVPLSLYSGITSSVTRAYDATWETNDQIGVFTVVAGQTDASKITYSGSNLDANIPYTATAGATYTSGSVASTSYNANSQTYNSFSPSDAANKIYLPLDGSNVDVYAYYPYDENASASGKDITLETNQTFEGQKGYDILKASSLTATSPINIDYPSTKLLFQHCLTKVLIVVKVGTGYSSVDLTNQTAVKLSNQPTSATFYPLTQAVTINTLSADFTDIVPLELSEGDPDYSKKSDGLYIYRALLLPNQNGNPATATGREIVFTIGAKTPGAATTIYRYVITKTLVAGQETIYTLTLNATGVSVTAAISPWTTQNVTPDDPLYEEQ